MAISENGKNNVLPHRGNLGHYSLALSLQANQNKAINTEFWQRKERSFVIYICKFPMLTLVEKNYVRNIGSWVFYDLSISP